MENLRQERDVKISWGNHGEIIPRKGRSLWLKNELRRETGESALSKRNGHHTNLHSHYKAEGPKPSRKKGRNRFKTGRKSGKK